MYQKKIITLIFLLYLLLSPVKAQESIFETSSATKATTKEQLDTINDIQKSIKVNKKTDKIEIEKAVSLVEGSVEKAKSMSLDECIRLALLNNPSIKAAVGNKEIYKTKIGQAWSAYFPSFSVGATYNRTRMLQTSFKVANPEYNLFNMPSIEASTLIYDFGKTRSIAKIAKKTYQASEDNLQRSINDTVYNVKEAYYSLLYAIQQEHVLNDTVNNYETHLEQAKNYYNIGAKPKIDVITAQYNLGESKLSLIKAKHEIDMAYAKLNNAMGIPEHAAYDIDEKFELPLFDFEFNNLLGTAKETRPELLAAQKKQEASELLVKSSKLAFMPDLRFGGAYTNGGTSPAATYSFQIGGGLQYQSVNLMLLKKQVDEAKATLKRDNAELEEAEQSVYLDVKAALIKFDNAKESIPVAKLSFLSAKEQYMLASGRYKTGLGDIIELKDAENTYLKAQLAYYNALLNYNIAFSNLERVVGTNLKNKQTDSAGQQNTKSI